MIMTQEDKELLLKDLCARIPYDVICEVKFKESGKYKSLSMSLFGIFKDEAYFTSQRGTVYSNDYKPYLFPLSSMTEEQKKKLLELTGYEARCEEDCGFDSWGFYVNIVGEYTYEDGKQSIVLYPDDIGIDWLNKNHFDYRGLIEKGLALNATGLNIY